jgi:N-terminal acetyltransferase B complex catalytic subunit
MAAIRPMGPMDLLKFNPCNLDHLTETYNIGFYLDYFTQWPHLCKVIEGPNGQIEAYSMRIPRHTTHTLTHSPFQQQPQQQQREH